ncbi:MAG: hypothetical protein AMQ74_01441 [Candidatus Methanofastidiosum methylothiophilum]|uniref:Uncharacterized protein n=1 Tax=Candidatus Methanofastidiosum methylothiophilum TaxID=1705564 RepID=A0A150IWM3_9EURY|nr:MAG: hypothetical protein AMQ74_01441 [Candidatus Methanofastidiosum methylthiophilus]
MKSITIKGIPDDLYFKLIELKGKMKAENWEDFLEKMVKMMEER